MHRKTFEGENTFRDSITCAPQSYIAAVIFPFAWRSAPFSRRLTIQILSFERAMLTPERAGMLSTLLVEFFSNLVPRKQKHYGDICVGEENCSFTYAAYPLGQRTYL